MTPISTKDLALIFFFTGMIFAFLLTFILLLTIHIKDIDPSIITLFPGFSFSFMFILCFFGVAINIQVFRKHRINYIYIFEIDPHLRISQEKIYRVYMSNYLGGFISVDTMDVLTYFNLCKCALWTLLNRNQLRTLINNNCTTHYNFLLAFSLFISHLQTSSF